VRAVPLVRESYAPGFFAGTVEVVALPAGAVDFLNRNPLPARLFHLYEWGGYIMFQTRGRSSPTGAGISCTRNAFYPRSLIAEYGIGGVVRVLARRGVSVIVWPSTTMAQGAPSTRAPRCSRLPRVAARVRRHRAACLAHVDRGRAWAEAYRGLALDYRTCRTARLFLADRYLPANRFAQARLLIQDASGVSRSRARTRRSIARGTARRSRLAALFRARSPRRARRTARRPRRTRRPRHARRAHAAWRARAWPVSAVRPLRAARSRRLREPLRLGCRSRGLKRER
jgi:hypothetical protein